MIFTTWPSGIRKGIERQLADTSRDPPRGAGIRKGIERAAEFDSMVADPNLESGKELKVQPVSSYCSWIGQTGIRKGIES